MSNNTETHHHIVPLKIYLAVAAALMVLTVVTVKASYIDLGGWNIVIALLIAGAKASLVVLYFMHLRYEWNMNTVVFLIAIAFLAIFIMITMFDMAERGATNPEKKEPISKRAAIYDESGKPFRADSLGHGGHGADSTADSVSHEADDLNADTVSGMQPDTVSNKTGENENGP